MTPLAVPQRGQGESAERLLQYNLTQQVTNILAIIESYYFTIDDLVIIPQPLVDKFKNFIHEQHLARLLQTIRIKMSGDSDTAETIESDIDLFFMSIAEQMKDFGVTLYALDSQHIKKQIKKYFEHLYEEVKTLLKQTHTDVKKAEHDTILVDLTKQINNAIDASIENTGGLSNTEKRRFLARIQKKKEKFVDDIICDLVRSLDTVDRSEKILPEISRLIQGRKHSETESYQQLISIVEYITGVQVEPKADNYGWAKKIKKKKQVLEEYKFADDNESHRK